MRADGAIDAMMLLMIAMMPRHAMPIAFPM